MEWINFKEIAIITDITARDERSWQFYIVWIHNPNPTIIIKDSLDELTEYRHQIIKKLDADT